MLKTKTLSRAVILPLIALLLFVPSAQAQSEYDLIVNSLDYQPGNPVNFVLRGPATIAFSIRVTDSMGDIIAGRDAALNATGGYTFSWSPGQEGEYNVTVTFSTGIIITKSFLIQRRVTTQDIADLYRAIFGVDRNLNALLSALDTKSNISLVIGGMALLISIGLIVWTRQNMSRAESEFEKLMKSYTDSAIMRKVGELQKKLESKPKE